MKFQTEEYYHQAYTDSWAYVLEVRKNGKVKAIKYSAYTNRATIAFIQNWHPLPALVANPLDIPQNVINKIKAKREAMK